MKIKKEYIYLGIIIFSAFLLRVVHISFPFFTADEARIAYRGYTLASTGTDELGRQFPIIFNSLIDYQLPLTSYLTAIGIFIFGKSDFGVRIPFIILGSALPFLVYQLSKIVSGRPSIWFLSALLIAFSPPLIFLSKVPNPDIILVFLLTLLFYLFTRSTLNFLFIITVFLLASLTSKYAWLILPPFVAFTLFVYQSNNLKKNAYLLTGVSLAVSIFAFIIFISLPEGLRSLKENNFTLFSDITISNGINRLRGQGIEMGWPALLPKLLFNKSIYLPVGFLHWLSNISPAVYFGQFEPLGLISFSNIGAWAKSLILPAALGIFFLIKEADKKQKLLLLYIFILSYPAIFKYPAFVPELVILTLPFMAIIIAWGIGQLKGFWQWGILGLMVLEVVLNVLLITPEIKAADSFRPGWIKPLAADISELSKTERVIISDNITEDSIPLFLWYGDMEREKKLFKESLPYRFRQSSLPNIILYGWDQKFQLCGREKIGILYLSKRDLSLVKQKINPDKIGIIKNGLNKESIYTFSNILCQE